MTQKIRLLVYGIVFCLWALIFIGPAVAKSAELESRLDADEAAAVDAVVAEQMEEQGLVGVAVGLLHDGKVVYLKGYGFADRERRTPVTNRTVFNWASNSKPLCAVAALQLVEAGKLDLDADVRSYVPEFPEHDAVITMRQLLCHQSGLPHYDGKVVAGPLRNPRKRPLADPVFALDMFSASPLEFEPGTKTSYSSYAYILAGAVVQRAGDEPLDAQIRRRIAEPLGMTSLQLDTASAGQADWAVGYDENDDGEVVRAPEFAHYWKHGGGAYKSNIIDFARWAEALLAGELLDEETYGEMWRLQKMQSGRADKWGLGFTVERQNGLKVSHNGKQDEATSRMVLYVDAGNGIVVLTNCGHGEPGEITTAIYEALEE